MKKLPRESMERDPAEIKASDFNAKRVYEAMDKFDFVKASQILNCCGHERTPKELRRTAQKLCEDVYQTAVCFESMTATSNFIEVESHFGCDDFGHPQHMVFTVTIRLVPLWESAVCLTTKATSEDYGKNDWILAAENRLDQKRSRNHISDR